MKNLCLLFLLGWLLVVLSPRITAQDFRLENALGAKLALVDHFTPLSVQPVRESLTDQLTAAGEITYYRGLNGWLNLAVPLRLGAAKIPIEDGVLGNSQFFASLDATLQLQPFLQKSRLSPYLLGGVGAFAGDGLSAELLFGAGLNVRLNDQWWLQAQGEFRKDSSPLRDNLVYSIGVVYVLQPADRPPPVDDRLTDRDGDGTADREDRCPDVAGPLVNQGCPLADRDGDGLADTEDRCPDAAGAVADGGCPDTDGDGRLDKDDPCPLVAGPLNGCPDRDRDGLADGEDRCPDTAGPLRNRGCPEITPEVQETLDYVAQNVAFETGRATLVERSFGILDQVVDILQRYVDYHVAIGGHTDSVGSADTNQILSERRAKSCYDYLQRLGINTERLSYVGYGETRPIADNRFKEGREQNRRVEFNLFLPR